MPEKERVSVSPKGQDTSMTVESEWQFARVRTDNGAYRRDFVDQSLGSVFVEGLGVYKTTNPEIANALLHDPELRCIRDPK